MTEPIPEDVKRGYVFLPMTRELIADAGDVAALINELLDRRHSPWKYPDRNPFPHLHLVPFGRQLDAIPDRWHALWAPYGPVDTLQARARIRLLAWRARR